MDRLNTEQNFQLAYAIGVIDSATEEIFGSTDSDAVFDGGEYNSRGNRVSK